MAGLVVCAAMVVVLIVGGVAHVARAQDPVCRQVVIELHDGAVLENAAISGNVVVRFVGDNVRVRGNHFSGNVEVITKP